MKNASNRRRGIAALLTAAACALVVAAAASAAINEDRNPQHLSASFNKSATITGTSWTTLPRTETDFGNPLPSPHAVSTSKLTGFPTNGSNYAILSTGRADIADDKNTAKDSGYEADFVAVRGDGDFDTSVMKVDFTAPAGSTCASFDFRFLSEEFPEFVGQKYNDAFIAELDSTTWSTTSSKISAPNNFATDENGKLISINSTGGTSVEADFADGTTYDGATRLLNAATPVSPGQHSLYLSIFDQGDGIYDSAAFLDNLVVDSRPAGKCQSGAEPVSNLPKTKITSGPGKTTKSRNITFKFKATGAGGASFECKLDKKDFAPCKSPKKLNNLDYGKHTFQVRAVGDDPDLSPAKSVFTVVKKK